MLVQYDENFARKVEAIAEALWQDESLRAADRPRLIPWSEVDGQERNKWTRYAQVALQTAQSVDAYAALESRKGSDAA